MGSKRKITHTEKFVRVVKGKRPQIDDSPDPECKPEVIPLPSSTTAMSWNSSVVDEEEAEVIDVDVDRVQAEEESEGDDQAEISQWKFY